MSPLALALGLLSIASVCLVSLSTVLLYVRIVAFERVSISFAVIVLPLLGLDVLVFVGTLLYLRLHSQHLGQHTSYNAGLSALALTVSAFFFLILLQRRLDHELDMPWLIVFTPIMVYLVCAEVLHWTSRRRRRESHSSLYLACLLVFVVVKLDGFVYWSWWLIFTPIWIGLGILCLLLLSSLCAWAVTRARAPHLRAPSSRGSSVDMSFVCFYTVIAMVLLVPLIMFCVSGTAYMENTWDVRLAQVFVPLFVFEGILLLLVLLAVLFAWRSFRDADAGAYARASSSREDDIELLRRARAPDARERSDEVELEPMSARSAAQRQRGSGSAGGEVTGCDSKRSNSDRA